MTSRYHDPNENSLYKVFMILMVCLAVAILLSSCGGTNQASNSNTAVPVSFSQDVAPIFNQRCIQCHSGSQASGQLDLSSYSAVMAGGATGLVILPRDAAGSLLISLVSSGQMPRSGAKLTPDQVTILENWVNSGAKEN